MVNMFFKDDGNNIVFTGHHMKVYVPESYFGIKLAEIEGSLLKVFGLLEYKVYDEKDRMIRQSTMNLPTMIVLHFNDIETTKETLYAVEGAEPEVYRTLTYYKNDIIMSNVIQKDSSNVELFVNLMTAGRIKNVPYNKILNIWQRNLELNGIDLGVPSSILEVIISEIYRNPKNPNEKFCKFITKNPKESQYYYRASNIREICSRNSTFSALTFEDFDSMLTASLNMNKYNKKQVESPIEKVIKM